MLKGRLVPAKPKGKNKFNRVEILPDSPAYFG